MLEHPFAYGCDCVVEVDAGKDHQVGCDQADVLAGCLALAGGVVAIVTLQIRRRFSGRAIALWAAIYATFVGYVAAAA